MNSDRAALPQLLDKRVTIEFRREAVPIKCDPELEAHFEKK